MAINGDNNPSIKPKLDFTATDGQPIEGYIQNQHTNDDPDIKNALNAEKFNEFERLFNVLATYIGDLSFSNNTIGSNIKNIQEDINEIETAVSPQTSNAPFPMWTLNGFVLDDPENLAPNRTSEQRLNKFGMVFNRTGNYYSATIAGGMGIIGNTLTSAEYIDQNRDDYTITLKENYHSLINNDGTPKIDLTLAPNSISASDWDTYGEQYNLADDSHISSGSISLNLRSYMASDILGSGTSKSTVYIRVHLGGSSYTYSDDSALTIDTFIGVIKDLDNISGITGIETIDVIYAYYPFRRDVVVIDNQSEDNNVSIPTIYYGERTKYPEDMYSGSIYTDTNIPYTLNNTTDRVIYYIEHYPWNTIDEMFTNSKHLDFTNNVVDMREYTNNRHMMKMLGNKEVLPRMSDLVSNTPYTTNGLENADFGDRDGSGNIVLGNLSAPDTPNVSSKNKSLYGNGTYYVYITASTNSGTVDLVFDVFDRDSNNISTKTISSIGTDETTYYFKFSADMTSINDIDIYRLIESHFELSTSTSTGQLLTISNISIMYDNTFAHMLFQDNTEYSTYKEHIIVNSFKTLIDGRFISTKLYKLPSIITTYPGYITCDEGGNIEYNDTYNKHINYSGKSYTHIINKGVDYYGFDRDIIGYAIYPAIFQDINSVDVTTCYELFAYINNTQDNIVSKINIVEEIDTSVMSTILRSNMDLIIHSVLNTNGIILASSNENNISISGVGNSKINLTSAISINQGYNINIKDITLSRDDDIITITQSDMLIDNCIFETTDNNRAIHMISSYLSSTTISNCYFNNGDGIEVDDGNIIITSNKFIDNNIAITLASGVRAVISNNYASGNTTTITGAGISSSEIRNNHWYYPYLLDNVIYWDTENTGENSTNYSFPDDIASNNKYIIREGTVINSNITIDTLENITIEFQPNVVINGNINITGCDNINIHSINENVTINGDIFIVSGNNININGAICYTIELENTNNSTVENCTLNPTFPKPKGISLFNSSNNRIQYNHILDSSNNIEISIYMTLASNSNTVLSNKIENSEHAGIYVSNTIDNIIKDNSISDILPISGNHNYGISVFSSSKHLISGNILTNVPGGIIIEGKHPDISLDIGCSHIISNNQIEVNNTTTSTYAIDISAGDNSIIESNNIICGSGIKIWNTTYVKSLNNNIKNSTTGIYVMESEFIDVYNNNIESGATCLYIINSNDINTIENNIIGKVYSGYDNRGIHISNSYNINIKSNNIEPVSGSGIDLINLQSNKINIHNNIIKLSGDATIGIRLEGNVNKDNSEVNVTYNKISVDNDEPFTGIETRLNYYDVLPGVGYLIAIGFNIENNVINGNNTSNSVGILLDSTFDTSINNNKIKEVYTGINISHAIYRGDGNSYTTNICGNNIECMEVGISGPDFYGNYNIDSNYINVINFYKPAVNFHLTTLQDVQFRFTNNRIICGTLTDSEVNTVEIENIDKVYFCDNVILLPFGETVPGDNSMPLNPNYGCYIIHCTDLIFNGNYIKTHRYGLWVNDINHVIATSNFIYGYGDLSLDETTIYFSQVSILVYTENIAHAGFYGIGSSISDNNVSPNYA